MKTIIRECDKCGNEDSIDCETGLCPSCEEELKNNVKKHLSKRNTTENKSKEIWDYCKTILADGVYIDEETEENALREIEFMIDNS